MSSSAADDDDAESKEMEEKDEIDYWMKRAQMLQSDNLMLIWPAHTESHCGGSQSQRGFMMYENMFFSS